MEKLAPALVFRQCVEVQTSFIRSLTSETTVEHLMGEVVSTVAKLLKPDACAVFTADRQNGRAVQRAGWGYQQRFTGERDVRVVPAKEVPDVPEPGSELGLTGWILSTGKPFLARTPEEFLAHPHHSGRFDKVQLPDRKLLVTSFLGVPFRGPRGEVTGMIKAERRLADPGESQTGPTEPFAEEDELALAMIARVAGRAVTYLEMAQRGEEIEAVTAWACDVVAEAAAMEEALDSFLDTVVPVTAAAMCADSCGIFLMDERGKTLTQRAGSGTQEVRSVIRAYTLPDPEVLGECISRTQCGPSTCPHWQERSKEPHDSPKRVGLTAWIAVTGKPFRARNFEELRAHCHHRGAYDKWNFPDLQTECGAFLGVPLRVGASVTGVIKVENRSAKGAAVERDFPRARQQCFELLAQDIALHIKQIQAQSPDRYTVVRKAERTILEILRGGADIPELVGKVIRQTKDLFNAGACALFLKEGNKLRQPKWAAAGYADRGPLREYPLVPAGDIEVDPSQDEKVGLTVWIAAMRKSFTARSNQELVMHPHHKGTFDESNFEQEKGERCESFMGFPLLIQDGDHQELVGVLKVESKRREAGGYTYFNEIDELVFELIANSVATAIQNARLLEMRRKAELALAASEARQGTWTEFSGMVAHRIGTEAAVIRGAYRWLGQDLARAPEIPGVERNVTRIGGSLSRLEGFVKEFTQYAAPPVLKMGRLNINALCGELRSYLAAQPITFCLASDLPDLWGDGGMLLDSFKEIVQNAITAMPNGGELTIKTSGGLREGVVRVEFLDSGPGIAYEIKNRIFEPGFTARSGGTGLGLAIVRRAIQGHQGTIEETGIPGRGAHFVIELPLSGSKPREPGVPPERVLIVEDNTFIREDLARIVTWDAPERQVIAVRNELEALDKLRTEKFDLVITDVKLDEAGGTPTGGLVVLEAAGAKSEPIPVIVVTAYGKTRIPGEDAEGGPIPVEERANGLGCYRFISRPDPTRDYLEIVRETVTQVFQQRSQPDLQILPAVR